MNLFSSNRCSVQMTHQVFQEARRLFFPCEAWILRLAWKNLLPFFFLPPSQFFLKLPHLRTFPHFSHFHA
jgi:hypothetical protein